MPTAFTAPSARGPERQETVVRYRPCALPSRILFTLLLSTLGAGFIVFAFFAARQVAVDCSRQTGLCVVTRTYPLFGPRRQSFDLAAIGGTSLRARRGKNGVLSYAVLLDTGAGPESISFQYAARGRQAQKRTLDAFLADPDAPPLHLDYDPGSPWAFLLFLAPAIWFWVLWTLWQDATVRFEWWRGAVVLERRRWPLRRWTRAFRLDEVTGADVDERGYRGRKTYRVELNLRSGESVPLLKVRGSGAGMHEQVAAEINAAIGHREPHPIF